MWFSVVALSTALLAVDDPRATVQVDSSRREVIVTAGPFDVSAMPPGMTHDEMEMMEDHNTPLLRFEWPVAGWVRGFDVEVLDAGGKLIDRRIIHHLIGVNFDRRQLLYPAVERLFGIGRETGAMMAPRSIGIPMTPGTKLGMYMAWQNETGADLSGIQIRVKLSYSPTNLNPRPIDALPLYMDVNLTVGGSNTYDVPAGTSEKAYEFTMPVDGRLLGYSGHMHDYGVAVRLEDVESGRVLAKTDAKLNKDGTITGMSRSLPGVRGDGIRLRAGRKYRVVGVYNNPTGQTIANHGMAHISGVFAPDDFSKWPTLDLTDPLTQEDIASLNEMGQNHHKHHQADNAPAAPHRHH